MTLKTCTKIWMAALATCSCAGLASQASAQCASYSIAPGTAAFIAGTTDITNHCDDCSNLITLPFSFTIYGNSVTTANASSNGTLAFGSTSAPFGNTCLPTTAFTPVTAPVIFPHWNDMRTDSAGNGIFTATLGATPTRTFVIEWRANFFDGTPGTANWSILLYEGQSSFDIVYNTVPVSGVGATSGIQASSTGSFTQFSCNAATLTTGLSLHYTCVAASNGACCAQDGTCSVIVSTSCASPSIFSGTGTTCSGAGGTCPSPVGACCSPCGVCSFVAGAAACAAGNTFSGNGTACSPNTCPAGAPVNDTCAGAIALTLATPVSGSNACATNDVSPCGLMGKTVWYKFTPAASGLFDVSLCGSPFDTVLAIYDSCGAATSLACNDDSCGLASFLGANQFIAPNTYFIVVGGFGGATGNYTLNVTANTTAGNCCNSSTAACSIVANAAACISPSTFTAGALCTPNPCVTAPGACCNQDGTCVVGSGANCTGLFQGPNTTCSGANNTCPSTTVGSCCSSTTGACTYVAALAACATPSVYTAGGVCVPSTCPAVGACCAPCCSVTLQASCTGTFTPNTTCTTSPCAAPANDACAGSIALTLGTPATGNNCNATDDSDLPSCTFGGPANSRKGVWYSFTPAATGLYETDTCGSAMPDTIMAIYSGACGTLTELASNDDSTSTTCPAGNTACTGAGTNGLNSRIPSVALTAGTTYRIQVSSYGTGTAAGGAYTVVVNTAGACCAGAVCTLSTSAACTGASTFAANVACTPNICVGVCCRGSTCNATVPFASCSATGGTAGASFAVGAAACNITGNTTTPCCYADYNKLNGIGVPDIFDFLADWFAGSPFANTGGDGNPAALQVQNIFDFLAAWFAGGC